VPDDVAVAGFDDIALAGFSEPPLTTVRQPVAEVAACIVRMLLSAEPAPDPVILPTELIVRESA
jgi:DNA-binding LacI/PurR family transcriptional regulator